MIKYTNLKSKTHVNFSVLSKVYLITLFVVLSFHVFAKDIKNKKISNKNLHSEVIGINGSACAYETFSQVLLDARPGDTIYISGTSYLTFVENITIDLTFVHAEAAAPDFSGCEQEVTPANTDKLIIDGNGVSNDNFGGVSKISNGATVTFRHIWFRNSNADNGGIFAVIEGSSLILDDVLVTDGTASISGGLVYVSSNTKQPSTLTLTNNTSLYRGKSFGNGGGVALYNSELNIISSNIGLSGFDEFNIAVNNGGGIYAVSSSVLVTSHDNPIDNATNIIWNEAGNNGGGVYAFETTFQIILAATNISNNNAISSGGGLYLSKGFANLSATVMDSNSTSNLEIDQGGGALFIANNSTTFLSVSMLSNNSSANLGGAVFVDPTSYIIVNNNSSISSNSAITGGGGLFVQGGITFNDSMLIENSTDGLLGGGLLIVGSSAENYIDNSTITQNSAISNIDGAGGGIGLDSMTGELNISGSTISLNSANKNGGGIYAKSTKPPFSGSVNLFNTTVSDNLTTNSANFANEGGAGAHFDSLESLSILETIFVENISANIGGGLFISNIGDVLISDSAFSTNSSRIGGGLSSKNSNVVINNNTKFIQNETINGAGGIRLNGGIMNINQAVFTSNSSSHGAGIYAVFASLEVINSQFIDNVATVFGGGIVIDRSNASIKSVSGTGPNQCDLTSLATNQYCSYFENNSSGEKAGAIMITSSFEDNINVEFSGVALINNQATLNGTAVFVQGDDELTTSLNNLLIADNGNNIDFSTTIEQTGANTLKIDSVTLVNNNDSPLRVTDTTASIELYNSILYANSTAPFVSAGVNFSRDCNNSQSVSVASQSMGGNLGDPFFITTNRGDYRLSANSPSIDQCLSGPQLDLDGYLRPNVNGSYDQGAFEFNSLLIDSIFINGFE